MSASNEKGEFSTIRIWREDKEVIDALKDHRRQPSHEIFHAVLLTYFLNDRNAVAMDKDTNMIISKSNPEHERLLKEYREKARRIVEGKD